MKKKCPHLDGRPLWISSGDADRESASGQQMPKLAVHVKRQGQVQLHDGGKSLFGIVSGILKF